jgi:hypothetical protein
MIETTFETTHAGAETTCDVDSDIGGELAEQAELVAFAHYVARVFLLLGPAQAGAIVDVLVSGRAGDWPPVATPSQTRTVVRFIDGAAGPRLYFRLDVRGKLYANLVVDALGKKLRERHPDDRFEGSLTRVAELMARLGATGQVGEHNEFDVALAAADVAWRSTGAATSAPLSPDLECRGCGYRGPAFEPRLWPRESAVLCKCGRCGAGVWSRAGHRARSIRPDIWSAMETMRSELAGVSSAQVEPQAAQTLLGELKRVFLENGWPYSEVAGAPVLLSELSGPEGSWDFYAHAVEEKDLVLLYSIAPDRVPAERRLEVSEFLTRANHGLADGNFELDFDDGEVRFKSVLHVPSELDGLLVKRVVRLNGTALETYLPSIAALIGQTPGNRH